MIALNILGGLAAVYLFVVLVVALFQRAMIYHPSARMAEPDQVGLAEMVPVPVRARDGWVVTGWYAPAQRQFSPTIVFFHGNTGSLLNGAAKARALLDAGYGVFLAEYRGYGPNRGRPSEAGLYNDGHAVLGWLTTRGIDLSRIVLYGESLGSGVATQLATQWEVAAVVLEAPFTSLTDLAPAFVIPPLPSLLMRDKFDNLSKIARVEAPLLILHGELDETVPVFMGRALHQAARGDHAAVFFPHGTHTNLWEQGADNAVFEFLAKRFRS